MKANAYVIFKDGHKDEIFYYEKAGKDSLLFCTAKGLFMATKHPNENDIKFSQCNLVYVDDVQSIYRYIETKEMVSLHIDTRVSCDFYTNIDDICINGSILIDPNDTETNILSNIAKKMGVIYKIRKDDTF